MSEYIALLRGINVGGNNIIKMADLKACFENMGFQKVVTYIQSGNVLFRADEKDTAKLTSQIEKTLSERFNYASRIVLITSSQIRETVTQAPQGFGAEPDLYRYDVAFLREPLLPEKVLENFTPREGVDTAWTGNGVLYFRRLISKAAQSYLNKLISLAAYKEMTIRNWNTTKKLLALAEG